MKSTLFLTMTLLLLAAPAQASEHPRVDRCRHKSSTELTISCLARGFDAPGSPSFAVRIADCESGLFARAVSPSGTFRGLFQQHVGYWSDRYRHFAAPLGLRRSIFAPLTNTIVSLRMARAAGDWNDWSGCARTHPEASSVFGVMATGGTP